MFYDCLTFFVVLENVKDKFWEGKGIVNENDEIVVLGRNMLGSIWTEIRSSLV
jgi:hypothetical protein